MKFWIIILGLLLNSSLAFSQLKIEEKSTQYSLQSTADITKFILDNRFDYALIAWHNSIWPRMYDNFNCLIKQENNWYLAKIVKRKDNSPVAKSVSDFTIYQKKLTKAQRDSVFKKLDPAKALQYSQDDFNKLPETCVYKINEKDSVIVYGVSDAATYHLIQLNDKKIGSLHFYAPDYYIDKCSVHLPEFDILKGFSQTVNQLSLINKIWKNNDH